MEIVEDKMSLKENIERATCSLRAYNLQQNLELSGRKCTIDYTKPDAFLEVIIGSSLILNFIPFHDAKNPN